MGKVDSHKKEVLSAWAENSHCLGIVKTISSQKYRQKPWETPRKFESVLQINLCH